MRFMPVFLKEVMEVSVMEEREILSRNIRLLRESSNLSQDQLANLLWIDRTSLSGYEHGKRVPDIFMLCRIADVFEVSLDDLLGREAECMIKKPRREDNIKKIDEI